MDPSNDVIKMLSDGLKSQEKNGITTITTKFCFFSRQWGNNELKKWFNKFKPNRILYIKL
jgi:hypothetical protein